jgi:signal transduction histidine kinase
MAGAMLVAATALSSTPVLASDDIVGVQAAAAALVSGLALFAALAGVAMLRARRRTVQTERDLGDEIARLNARLARAEALNRFDDQVVIAWDAPGEPPREAIGRMSGLAGVPPDATSLVAFDGWLAPDSARGLGNLVNSLQDRGESFSTIVRTLHGEHVEAEGRCAGSSVLLRFRDISPERLELTRIAERHSALLRDVEALRAILVEVPHPAWIRDASGVLAWVNNAYARAVDASDAASAVERGVEFLDNPAREEAGRYLAAGRPWHRRITCVTAGNRRAFDVVMVPVARGIAGIATDVSEVESRRGELERLVAAHQRTLDNLPTPVAVFGGDRRLVFHNAAWRDLWGLDPAFLAERPDEGAVLDRLREARKLPEQANYREWKAQHLEAYRSVESRECWWHLPDGRTIRSYTQPNPQGGLTLIQENVTEVLDLRTQMSAKERTQRETFEALTDAVAVFGSDGKLRLSNPAFARMWQLDPAVLAAGPHIDTVIAGFRAIHDDPGFWARLKGGVIAFAEDRAAATLRLERRDGIVIDIATVPLPEGAALVTFVDATASVNVERALQEKNDALVAADRLKNAFVQHVSYELRSPLTNIIGFAQLLSDPGIGPLNDKQREYMGYIMSSSSSLLAIINDILDLATLDAGAMQLDLTRVDIRETMAAAAEGLRDRLADEGIKLEVSASPDIGGVVADAKRVRQVLYNLLSNAVGFSEKGQVVRISARRNAAGDVVFTVSDSGRGIDAETLAQVFQRFETRTAGSRHRGAGLGLSIVKAFVELHGGTVDIESAPGRGTTVTCTFPAVARERPAEGQAA